MSLIRAGRGRFRCQSEDAGPRATTGINTLTTFDHALTGKTSPSTAAETPVKKPTTKKKKAPPKKKVPTVKKADPTDEEAPPKRVVRDGSTTEPVNQISPSVPEQQASSQLQKTNDLLSAADTNLKSISGAQLNSNQEDMVKQVKTYMEQAKTAAEMGDLERANNLATKAQLLSAELVKK